jgi:hypothetical protein
MSGAADDIGDVDVSTLWRRAAPECALLQTLRQGRGDGVDRADPA